MISIGSCCANWALGARISSRPALSAFSLIVASLVMLSELSCKANPTVAAGDTHECMDNDQENVRFFVSYKRVLIEARRL